MKFSLYCLCGSAQNEQLASIKIGEVVHDRLHAEQHLEILVDMLQGEINPLTDFLQVENDDIPPAEVVKRTKLETRIDVEHTGITGNLAKAHVSLENLNGPSRVFLLRREQTGLKIMGSSSPFNFTKPITPEKKVAIAAQLVYDSSSTRPGLSPSVGAQTQRQQASEETANSSQNQDSRPEFDFDNFRRVLESIEESKEELQSFEDQHSSLYTQRTLQHELSFVNSNGTLEQTTAIREWPGMEDYNEHEDDCICGPNCSLKRLVKDEDLLANEEDIVDRIVQLYPEEEKFVELESESKAQTMLDFPRCSGRHYFRCTLNSPSKRLYTIEEINSSLSEAFDESQFLRRKDDSEISSSKMYSPAPLHRRSKTACVAPIQNEVEPLTQEFIKDAVEVKPPLPKQVSKNKEKKNLRAPFSNQVTENKRKKLVSPPLSHRNTKTSKAASQASKTAPQTSNVVVLTSSSAGKGKGRIFTLTA